MLSIPNLKRDGEALSNEEIAAFVQAVTQKTSENQTLRSGQNSGPNQRDDVFTLGAELLLMTGSVSELSEGRRQITDTVTGGAALTRFRAMMEAQGVDAEAAQTLCSPNTDYHRVPGRSVHQMKLMTPEDGLVLGVDGLTLAHVLHNLGAGQTRVGEPVNHCVGAELLVSLGQRVRRDIPWLRLHYEDPSPSPDQMDQLQTALVLGPDDNSQSQQAHVLV